MDKRTYDNSALDCFRNCPQFYHLRIGMGLTKPTDRKTAADFGSSIHVALEHYYGAGMTDGAIGEAVLKSVKSFAPSIDPEDDLHTPQKLIDLEAGYFDRYHKKEPFNVVATEIGGAVELGEDLYTFRIDLVMEWISPKGIYGMDHKSSSRLYNLIPKPHNQITGYMFALQQQYENVVGFMINGIGVYKSDLEVDKTTRKKVPRNNFPRFPTARTQLEIDQWKRETLHLIKMIESCEQSGVWPRYAPNFCTAYKKCMFRDICLAQDESIIAPLVDGGIYVINPWVPYEQVKVEGGEEE